MNPPISKRFCISCDEVRTFIYNRYIGHSECVKCGGRKALQEVPSNNIDANNIKKIRKLEEEIKCLKHDIFVLETMIKARDKNDILPDMQMPVQKKE